MRTFLLLFFFVLSGIFASAQTVIIEKNELIINGVHLSKESLIDDYIAVLGQPDRMLNLVNNIYVYDQLGIYIYENYLNKNAIIEVSFDFKKDKEFDFSPETKFKGKIFLPGYNFSLNRSVGFRKLGRVCRKNENETLEIDFSDSEFQYGELDLLFTHGFFRGGTSNFTVDFR